MLIRVPYAQPNTQVRTEKHRSQICLRKCVKLLYLKWWPRAKCLTFCYLQSDFHNEIGYELHTSFLYFTVDSSSSDNSGIDDIIWDCSLPSSHMTVQSFDPIFRNTKTSYIKNANRKLNKVHSECASVVDDNLVPRSCANDASICGNVG